MNIDRLVTDMILEHYGIENQLLKTAEELGECQTAILQLLTKGTGKDNVNINKLYGEVADVYIMLEQVVSGLLDEEILQSVIGKKMIRQLHRIGDE